jgi:hypothetical protein
VVESSEERGVEKSSGLDSRDSDGAKRWVEAGEVMSLQLGIVTSTVG